PTIPCRFALKVLAPGPIASVASLTPIAIVKFSFPLLNDVPARPIVAPCSDSGPRAIASVEVPDAGESVVTVKLPLPAAPGSVPPLFGRVTDQVDVPEAAAGKATSISPATNMSAVV